MKDKLLYRFFPLLCALALLLCCFPALAVPVAADSIYSVRGVWYLNDTLDLSQFTTEHFEYVNFTVQGYDCNRLCLCQLNSSENWFNANFYNSSGVYDTCSIWRYSTTHGYTGYFDDARRYIDFGSEPQEVSGTFYNWLINNAVKSIHSVDIAYVQKQYYPGMDVVFSGYVYGAGEYDSFLNWTVSGQNSENTTINSVNGLLSIAPDETSYYLAVRATSVQDPSMYKEVYLSLRELPYPGDLVIVPESTEVSVGSSYELQFRVKYAGSEEYIEGGEFFDHPALIWEVAGTTAEYFSITEDGLLLISESAQAPAQATVTVRYSWDDSPLFDMSSAVSLKNQDSSDQLDDIISGGQAGEDLGNAGDGLDNSNDELGGAMGDYNDALDQVPTVGDDIEDQIQDNLSGFDDSILSDLMPWYDEEYADFWDVMVLPPVSSLSVSLLLYFVFGKANLR